MMNITTGDFLISTPTNFHSNIPSRRASYTGSTGRRRESAEGCRASDQQVPISEQAKLMELETVKRVLDVLKEGGMDVVGFLDALCWENLLAVTDPTVRAARTSLTHSGRLATVVLKWLDPPRTSQGGSKAGGARDTVLPLMIRTVKQIINKEMDVVVEELWKTQQRLPSRLSLVQLLMKSRANSRS